MSNGLGRGLSSLIPQKSINNNNADGPAGDPVLSHKDKILQIETEKIEANPMQPRSEFSDRNLSELAESIREYGIVQPLVVTLSEDKYELIAGERRLRAAKQLGLKKVPVIVRDAGRQEKLEVALIENIQRQDLNPIELALGYQRLGNEFNLTQEEVAKKVGKSRPSVANTLRLLSLPDQVKQGLVEGRITEGHAKYLIGLESEDKQIKLYNKILRTNMSVRDTDKEAKNMGGTKQARVKLNYADREKELALREFFGAKVEIKRRGKSGRIVIDFYSDDELGEIVEKVNH